MSDNRDHSEESDSEFDQHFPVRRFLDPVHDYVVFEPRVAAFIDTPQFQRLRYLKQLGTAYFVFPGAAHNRSCSFMPAFSSSHSPNFYILGVGHLARLMVDNLRARQPKLGIDDRDVLCVQIAGLMHDLGHGPFSHVFDNNLVPRLCPGTSWSHEEGSEMMFDSLLEQNPHIELEPSWINFIKDLIRGRPNLTLTHSPAEKPFLFQIVANMENGIDVDKLSPAFDYIARDTVNCGDKCSVSTSRLINSCRVIDNHIAYDYKDFYNVCELFHTRFSLHKRIYHHKTAKAIEYMIVDALCAADPVLHIADKIRKPLEYLFLTDSVVQDIERSHDPALAESRAIIARLRRRQLYKQVDVKVLPVRFKVLWEPHLTPENIAAEAARIPLVEGIDGGQALSPEDIIVDWSTLHMGLKEKDPMQYVKFYTSFVARPHEGSIVLPEIHQEVQIRVFTRDVRIWFKLLPCFARNPARFRRFPASFTVGNVTPPAPPASLPSLTQGGSQTTPSAPVTPRLSGSFEFASPSTIHKSSFAKVPNQFTTIGKSQASPLASARMKRTREANLEESPAARGSPGPTRRKPRLL
ncbi:hypothetical protein BS47DRAFT_1398828 [Hydnum rufescens UP504]|uniref:HD domain-containing protein n=1 Tax=Hydnum rufescens UP504 TaxID=1448309 RepID=A0A9P6AKU1_9AGAM|nr:hypothetical protein BS47DRAFT_1398828 [Hydnum rufescens UP504]